MNLVLAVHHFPPVHSSGAELVAYRIARWLIEQGHTARVVCINTIDDVNQPGRMGWRDDVYNGVSVRRLSFNLPAIPQTLRLWFDHPLLQEHFQTLFSEERPDLVHLISGYLLGIAPMQAAQRLKIPTVVTLTDFWFLCHTVRLLRGDGSLCAGPQPLECVRCIYDGKRTFKWLDQRAPRLVQQFWQMASRIPLLGDRFDLFELLDTLKERQRLLRQTLDSADAVITPTRFLADIHAKNQIETRQWTIIPIYLDQKPSGIIPTRPSAASIHFGYLGQVVPIKGVEILIRAFRKLNRSRRGARLTIYGALDADPNYVRRLRQLASDDADIVFADRYENAAVLNILMGLDCIVVPSIWYENGPVVILEAFAARVPVIGSHLGGIAEFVRHEENGLLFERGNVDALAQQLQRVLDDPTVLPQLRQRIPPVREASQELHKLLAVYQNVLERRHVDRSKVEARQFV